MIYKDIFLYILSTKFFIKEANLEINRAFFLSFLLIIDFLFHNYPWFCCIYLASDLLGLVSFTRIALIKQLEKILDVHMLN